MTQNMEEPSQGVVPSPNPEIAMSPEELVSTGLQHMASGDFRYALAFFVAAADAFGQHEDARGTCHALTEAADCYRMLDAPDDALPLIEAALQIAESISDPTLICHAKMIQGMMLDDWGDRLEAASVLKEAAELAEQQIENPLFRCNTFLCYGDVLYMIGQPFEAKRLLEKAAHIASDELTDPETEPSHHRARCNSFVSYGEVLVFFNEEQGLDWLKEAAQLARHEFCDPHTRCMVYKSYGEALRVLGRPLEARLWIDEARYVAEEQPLDSQTRCQVHMLSGQVLRDLQQEDEAIEELGIAAQIAEEELHDDHYRCLTLYRYGDVLRWSGAVEKAEPLLSRAATLAEQIPDKHTGCAALRSHAEMLISLGRLDEARQQLNRAGALAMDVPDPLLRCNLETSLMNLSAQQEHWNEAWHHAQHSQKLVLETLGANRSMRGIAHFLSVYHPILDVALTAAEQLWSRGKAGLSESLTPLDLLTVVDGSKCVAIREGLRRHLGSSGAETSCEAVAWHPGPQPWEAAFRQLPISTALGTRQKLRGSLRMDREPLSLQLERSLELPLGVVEKNRYCQPIDEDGLRRIIPDASTLLLHFFFHGDDLLIFLIYRDSTGALTVLDLGGSRPYRVPGVRGLLKELVTRQRNGVYDIAMTILDAPNSADVDASKLVQSGLDLSAIYREAARVLQLSPTLSRFECEIGPLDGLHLIIIPDGPLFQLPLHALVANDDHRRLYEMFASVRYGVSLRTLDLLGAAVSCSPSERQNNVVGIQGVVFAHPAGGLQGAFEEVRELVTATSPDRWWVHGDSDEAEYQATRAHFQKRHAAGNLLWLIGHGDKYQDTIDGMSIIEPSFLLQDGPLGISRLLYAPHDFSAVNLLMVSACWLGEVDAELGFSREIESYHAVLALRGCSRVTTALWPLSDVVAPRFARHFIGALRKHAFGYHTPPPNAFSLAFKKALDVFRADEGRRFDHEYFWAPYTLYGLG